MIRKCVHQIRHEYVCLVNRIKCRGKKKIFVIGKNKTGTTSLKKAFEDLGFVVGNEFDAVLLADKYYFTRNFAPIIDYCKTAQVFQDAPFSWPETFKYMDKASPGSKFILSIRDDADQWYRSLTQFHAKLYGNGKIPTIEDLRNASIRLKRPVNVVRVHETPENDPYNKEIMVAQYNRHNESVIEYFKDRPDDLLVINLAEKGAYRRFVDFIGVQSPYSDFPWENRT